MNNQNVLEYMNRQYELIETEGERARQRVEQVMLEIARLQSERERTMREIGLMEFDRERVSQVMRETARALHERIRASQEVQPMMRETARALHEHIRAMRGFELAVPPRQVQATPRLEQDTEQPQFIIRKSRPIALPEEVSSDSYSR